MPHGARRPLSSAETEVLDFLLDVTPADERPVRPAVLRQQVAGTSVIQRWDCCPSIELAVGTDDPPPLSDSAGPLVTAKHRTQPYELMLFITPDHRLRALELVHFGEENPTRFPPVSEFEEPVWYTDWQPLVSI